MGTGSGIQSCPGCAGGGNAGARGFSCRSRYGRLERRKKAGRAGTHPELTIESALSTSGLVRARMGEAMSNDSVMPESHRQRAQSAPRRSAERDNAERRGSLMAIPHVVL